MTAVVLFIDRLPLQSRVIESAGRRVRVWYPLVPAILTDSKPIQPASDIPARPWKFDTGCTPETCAWRFHLERAGLDTTDPEGLYPRTAKIRAANGAIEELPIREASLWLVSNIPAFRQAPYPVFPRPGVPFYDRAPRQTEHLYPLIGMGAFRRAGLTVKIDFAAATLSVWTPGPWYGGASLFLRRIPGRFATIPFEQLCPSGWH